MIWHISTYSSEFNPFTYLIGSHLGKDQLVSGLEKPLNFLPLLAITTSILEDSAVSWSSILLKHLIEIACDTHFYNDFFISLRLLQAFLDNPVIIMYQVFFFRTSLKIYLTPLNPLSVHPFVCPSDHLYIRLSVHVSINETRMKGNYILTSFCNFKIILIVSEGLKGLFKVLNV